MLEGVESVFSCFWVLKGVESVFQCFWVLEGVESVFQCFWVLESVESVFQCFWVLKECFKNFTKCFFRDLPLAQDILCFILKYIYNPLTLKYGLSRHNSKEEFFNSFSLHRSLRVYIRLLI